MEGHGDGEEGGVGRVEVGGAEVSGEGVAELDAQVEGETAGARVLGFEDGGAEGAGPCTEADGVGPREAGVAAGGAGGWVARNFVGTNLSGAAGAVGRVGVGAPVGVGSADGPGG